jgi:glycosyltransferase involved in cell wall biosynthesis
LPSLSLVIPAYNEEATIADIMRRSLNVLRACTDDYELIVLDDASRDATFAIMQGIAATDPRVRIDRHGNNMGIAATFEELYSLATKEYVFLISGDGQFPPETLLSCMPLLGQYDIVICKRTYKHYTLYRHVVSFCYRWLPRILFGVDLIDPGGVKCVRREIYTDIHVRSTSVFVEAERIIRAVKRGKTLTSVDMVQVPRKGGKAAGGRIGTVSQSVLDMIVCWWQLQVLRQKP